MSQTVNINTSDSIDLRWLVRLRWGAVFGQCLTILIVQIALGIKLPNLELGLLVLAGLASNSFLHWRSIRSHHITAQSGALLMAFDIGVLTGLLFFSGGPSNPFNFLYLVYLALSALVLPALWTFGLVGLSLVCFGMLFVGHDASSMHHHDTMAYHLEGMWVAFGVAAVFIVTFMLRLRGILARREEELESAQRRSLQREKLASLATLAAGAAHELATPLSVIAIASKELLRTSKADQTPSAVTDDLLLIREQVDLCGHILRQMSADIGTKNPDWTKNILPKELCEEAILPLQDPNRIQLIDRTGDNALPLRAPKQNLTRAIRSVLKNALDATNPGDTVTLTLEQDAQQTHFSVQDQGPGMNPDVLQQATEPFFTTKAPGKGMGLGLFLAQEVTQHLGGSLDIESVVDQGSLVTLRVPTTPIPNKEIAP